MDRIVTMSDGTIVRPAGKFFYEYLVGPSEPEIRTRVGLVAEATGFHVKDVSEILREYLHQAAKRAE